MIDDAVIVRDLERLTLDHSQLIIYDRPIGLKLLYQDAESGAEHYLIRYPAGLRAQRHRHTSAHTIVLLDGRLRVNDQEIGLGSYCHFPAQAPMLHEPAGNAACLFVTIFDGPFDVEPLDDDHGQPTSR